MSRSVAARLALTLVVAVMAGANLSPVALAQGTAPSPSDTSVTRALPRKSAAVAGLLATVIPGSGHVYAGEGRRGLIVLGGAIGLATVSFAITVGDCMNDVVDGVTADDCGVNPFSAIGAVALVGLWGWNIYDAVKATERTNARARAGSRPSDSRVTDARAAALTRLPVTIGVTRRPAANGDAVRAVAVGMRFAVR